MFRYNFIIISFFLFLTLPVHAQNFENVLIKGNKRISNETILVFSQLPNEQFLDEGSINKILKDLYKTGFFKDVVVKIEDNNLIIDVTENPVIQTVFLEGIKKKATEDSLNEILSLKNRSSFNSTLVKKDEEAILNFLRKEGYYFAKVISSFNELNDNKIDLFYRIDLGDKAKITKISFIGDKKFKNVTLRNIIISEEYKFWKIVSGKKFLNEALVNLDKRLLKNYYKNKGFYNVNIESSFANYLGNSEFELIYNINSGKKYYFNDLVLNLPIDYDEDNFKNLKEMFADLKGKKYSLNSIDEILNEINKIVLNEQYEFLKSSVNEATKDNLINLTFNIDESDKFYVEKINIYGNNVTQEEVIRNALLTDEGDAFNELLHNKTINNLKSLDFFNNVNTDIINGTEDNQKIINITLDEKATGEISAGAGIGTNGGSVAFGVTENNFLGRGIAFGTDLAFSSESVKGVVSFDNPNYKGTNRSLNLSAESAVTDRLKTYGYESNKTGFLVSSGFEFYEDIFLNTGISAYVEDLKTNSTASTNLKKQEGSYFDTYFNYSFTYDKRNQKYQPTDGFRSRFTQNVPLISDGYSLKNTYDLKIYNQWLKENIATFGFYASTTNSLTGKNVKLSDRLFMPASRLRGFEVGKIGPRDNSDYIGGNYALAFNISTTLPQILPNLQNTDFSLFFDSANLWGVDYSESVGDKSKIRTAVGFAVDFFTPIGPLSISFAEPISVGKLDITETFRFNLGTSF